MKWCVNLLWGKENMKAPYYHTTAKLVIIQIIGVELLAKNGLIL